MGKKFWRRLLILFFVSGTILPQPPDIISPLLAQSAQGEQSEIKAVLLRLDQALKAKDIKAALSAFPRDEDVTFIGPDQAERALDSNSLKTVLMKQFESVSGYEVTVIETKILLDPAGSWARYYRLADLRFFSQGLPFAIKGVRETGLLKRKEKGWVIIQQHASVPVGEAVWPYYIPPDPRRTTGSGLERRVRVEGMKEDLDILRLALEEAHAGLYQYTSPEEFDDLFIRLSQRILTEMMEIDFYRELAPLVARIGCNHTILTPSREYREAMAKEKKFFPLSLKFLDGRGYVVQSFLPSPAVPLGSEILALNSRPLADIVALFLKVLPTDGRNQTYIFRTLDESFSEKYFLHVGPSDEFVVTFKALSKERESTVTIPAVTLERFRQENPSLEEFYKDALKLEVRPDAPVAIMTVKTFVPHILQRLGFDYARFLAESFRTIKEKNVRNLIIDLRGNDGGEGSADILTYLLPKPFQVNARIDTPHTRYSFLEHTDKSLFFNRFHARLWTRDGDRYLLKGRWDREKEPQEPLFEGPVYVLINGQSISATSAFAALAHFHRRAVFIGEETGGAYWGGTSGDYLNLTLPHSQIMVRIPIRRYVHAVSGYPYPDRGVIPDYPLTPSIRDILQGRDIEMDFALRLIRQKGDPDPFTPEP